MPARLLVKASECILLFIVFRSSNSWERREKAQKNKAYFCKRSETCKKLGPVQNRNPPHKQNRAKIRQRDRKSKFLSIFDAFLPPTLRSRPPFTGVPGGPGRKVPHTVLFECFWAPGSECPRPPFTGVPGAAGTPVNGGRDRNPALRVAVFSYPVEAKSFPRRNKQGNQKGKQTQIRVGRL